jgi:hypothetical protein
MKQSPLKKTFNNPIWNHILTFLGVVAVIDWIVFPALTAPSTIFNILGLLILIGTTVFIFHYIKDTWFTKSDEEKRMEADWEAEVAKKTKDIKKNLKNIN